MIHAGISLPHLAGCGLGLFLESRITPIKEIKSPGDLARQFHVGDLILAHRYVTGLVDNNIRGLQQGIAA